MVSQGLFVDTYNISVYSVGMLNEQREHTMNYGIETERLMFMINRDGLEEAVRFAVQTRNIYRTAVVKKKVSREMRRTYIESYLCFKQFVADHS